jgi:septal ring factor EnvC (AmiA/AmiB activator)
MKGNGLLIAEFALTTSEVFCPMGGRIMRHKFALDAAAALLGSGAASASPVEAIGPLQLAQYSQERREVLREQRDVRDAREDFRDARGDLKDAQRDLRDAQRNLRQADTARERRLARENLRDAQREVREERRDFREERRDLLEEHRELRDARDEYRDALMRRPEVRTRVHRYVTTTRTRIIQAPSGFTVATGAVLPGNIMLEAFPADVGLTEYRYVVIGQQPVIVEPRTRRIVEVIR